MKDSNRDFQERWKEESRRMFDSSEAKKSFENVFDHDTSMALLKLKDRDVIQKMYGTIEAGKESVVFLADSPKGERLIVKIYMNQAGGFRDMYQYLRGDKRFRGVKKDRKSVIKEWCKKEFKNLKKASKVLECPNPIAFNENILVMSFIGEDFSPYPKLKDVEIDNPEAGFKRVLDDIRRLWQEEKLVHGDLSEYNILLDSEGELYFIDFAQGLHTSHPEAENFLRRDIENVANFFRKQGGDIDVEKSFESVLEG
ncbi:serine protein kinase RIO [Candidatus Nanohalobium constans]|uniref:non-specific serine/threonine protein kinase n=1 Tax=Candidatus Nanohalobium constans TaxID=2565781 RepID=A0A5Q0UGU4_9ARCH|nr:serine protein kinase RIO [Candidatus Nanohalobium constans]QGA80848.1 serine/threonine protein kinase [Candidatus Nanohalobium constans]